MNKGATIAELKTLNPVPPPSPRKCATSLHCAIISKSELKNTKSNSKMFTMNLCDEDPTSFIKAVCFDSSLYDNFESMKTYHFTGFKIKKAMAAGNSHELHIDANTKFTESPFQFPMENIWFNISHILRHDADHVSSLNVKAKVIAIDESVTVGKYPDQKEKRDITLADETGQMTLVLWRQRAREINFKENDVISIQNAVTSIFNSKVNITSTSETIIKVVQELITVTTKKADVPKNTSITSLETTILATREFRTFLNCINCRCDIEHNAETFAESLITCTNCTTAFLYQSSKLRSECTVLLSASNQWFKAKTGVSRIYSISRKILLRNVQY
jgi:hypothetical protein